MIAAKKIETAANTEYVNREIFNLEEDKELDYKQTFCLDWELYKGKASDKIKEKVYL